VAVGGQREGSASKLREVEKILGKTLVCGVRRVWEKRANLRIFQKMLPFSKTQRLGECGERVGGGVCVCVYVCVCGLRVGWCVGKSKF